MERKAKAIMAIDVPNRMSLFSVKALLIKGMTPSPMMGKEAVCTPNEMMAYTHL